MATVSHGFHIHGTDAARGHRSRILRPIHSSPDRLTPKFPNRVDSICATVGSLVGTHSTLEVGPRRVRILSIKNNTAGSKLLSPATSHEAKRGHNKFRGVTPSRTEVRRKKEVTGYSDRGKDPQDVQNSPQLSEDVQECAVVQRSGKHMARSFQWISKEVRGSPQSSKNTTKSPNRSHQGSTNQKMLIKTNGTSKNTVTRRKWEVVKT